MVGVPAAGQPLVDQPGLVGHCVSLLPMRLRVDMDQPMARQISAAREVVLDAFEHPGCTFGRLLQKLNIKPCSYGLIATNVYDGGEVFPIDALNTTSACPPGP